MIARWPWGNCDWDPDFEVFAPQQDPVLTVEWDDPEPPPLLGPHGEPLLPPRPPIGFALPTPRPPAAVQEQRP